MIYHPDPTAFIESAEKYGSLGKTLVELSNLELAHDEFVFRMHKTNQDFSTRLSKTFPRQFKEKTNYLINSISHSPALRKVPIFQNGELNLLWLQYQLDELYEIRTIIAHGSIFFSVSTSDRITWTFERYVSKEKYAWNREAVEISNGYLASVFHTASHIKHYLTRLTRCLENISDWEEDYQADKQVRKGRENIAELIAIGVINGDDTLIAESPPLGPVE